MLRGPALLTLVLSLGAVLTGRAQCVNPIAAFPYGEGFENGPQWTAGGISSDWAWGTPAHPSINSAGGGVRSWCVGGLTGTFYNYGELSWLESPCFDMSALDHPWISFKIFWECERQYDGMTFQLSLNGGQTWSNVGAWGDPVDCLNDNWFNAGNITNLTSASPKHGWSGRSGSTSGSCQGGFGSGGWVTAKHCMPAAANQPQVIFRFLFGAGTQCNGYDGIAIDDILIQEAEGAIADFTWTCAGASASFTPVAGGCPTSWTWDFGDPASGGQNSSFSQNPSHTFSGPGTYSVTLTTDGPCSDPVSITLPVVVPEVSVDVIDADCSGVLGSASAVVATGTIGITYSWSPGGGSGASITGLAPGTYTVTVTEAGGCSSTATGVVNGPVPVQVQAMADTIVCEGAALTLLATSTGGTGAVQLTWSPTGPVLNPAVAGTYSVVAVDAAGCTSTADDVVVGVAPLPQPTVQVDALAGCAPLCVSLAVQGVGAGTTTWDLGDGTTASGATVQHCYAQEGSFVPTVAHEVLPGCAGTANGAPLIVNAPPVAAFTVPAVVQEGSGAVPIVDASLDAVLWSWDLGDGSTASGPQPQHTYADLGCRTISLVVTDAAGCTDGTSAEVCVEGDYAFHAPNAFTPDADGINDVFLPRSTVQRPQAYELRIHDRWGALRFLSSELSEGWDGEGEPQGVYTWTVMLRDGFGTRHLHRGHVSLLR
ncbi:MAG: PKD domain-containing protein [Flavobacteriales bacterium]|nr:PKD domain-containing protein [Flavobacteriales bacterium]MBK7941033.1 PKD domain-containing protein [Flavobacteriales bacterium]MBK9701543.1 PKD domain-containing protein [Flavobacteriales bacterium]